MGQEQQLNIIKHCSSHKVPELLHLNTPLCPQSEGLTGRHWFSFFCLMSSPVEISGQLTVLYQSFKVFPSTAHIACRSCALYLSFMSFLTAVFLSFLRALGPSGLCTTFLTLCMRSHFLQLEASHFSLSLFQTYT